MDMNAARISAPWSIGAVSGSKASYAISRVVESAGGWSYRGRVSGTRADTQEPRTAHILARVRAIPAGFVRTYGDINPDAPRLVGRVLATTHDRLPWHRVVRADGSLAKGKRQRELLLEEGVPMRGDRVDLRVARLPLEF